MNNEISKLYHNKDGNYFSAVRTEIDALLPKFSEKILDVGCGDGSTLLWIKSIQKCKKIYGIELFEKPFLQAKKKLDQALNINVENEKNFFSNEKFDLILILDVLEHLVNPWKFLEYIQKRLNLNGSIIISVPNIRHYSVLKNLIFFGDWNYTKSGILDSSHLRFFTKKSLQRIFAEQGLKCKMLKKYPVDYSGKASIVNKVSLNLFSDFLTSQLIFKLEKC